MDEYQKKENRMLYEDGRTAMESKDRLTQAAEIGRGIRGGTVKGLVNGEDPGMGMREFLRTRIQRDAQQVKAQVSVFEVHNDNLNRLAQLIEAHPEIIEMVDLLKACGYLR